MTLGMVVMMAVMLSGMVWGVAAAVRSRRGGARGRNSEAGDAHVGRPHLGSTGGGAA
jgi:hypothetical protein